MKFNTNQQPAKKIKTEKRKSESVESNYLMLHGRNYCDCLEHVQHYCSLAKDFVVVYADVKNDLKHFHQEENLSWQIWRKHYSPPLKYYLASLILDKSVLEYDNNTPEPKEGYKRLYRGIPRQDLVSKKSVIKKSRSFVKKILAK